MPASLSCHVNKEANITPKPLISFVIPVLNGEKDIARCLGSIHDQKCPQGTYEVLILDNGSTDLTHQILRALAYDFEVVPNVTVSALRNRGAAKARGEYIAFIDADMTLGLTWLQGTLEAFKNQQIVACGCFPDIPEHATWVQKIWSLHRRCRLSTVNPAPVSWLGSANLVVRRADFLAIGGFDEELPTTEDVDLCYRLAECGIILHQPAMKAIHWGEDPDLRTFWRKEIWRGTGNIKGLFAHGFRWDEVPSLGYPLYLVVLGILLCLSLMRDVWQQQILLSPLALLLFILPAIYLSVSTTFLANATREILQLFLLFLIYGVARAYSMLKVGVGWFRRSAPRPSSSIAKEHTS